MVTLFGSTFLFNTLLLVVGSLALSVVDLYVLLDQVKRVSMSLADARYWIAITCNIHSVLFYFLIQIIGAKEI